MMTLMMTLQFLRRKITLPLMMKLSVTNQKQRSPIIAKKNSKKKRLRQKMILQKRAMKSLKVRREIDILQKVVRQVPKDRDWKVPKMILKMRKNPEVSSPSKKAKDLFLSKIRSLSHHILELISTLVRIQDLQAAMLHLTILRFQLIECSHLECQVTHALFILCYLKPCTECKDHFPYFLATTPAHRDMVLFQVLQFLLWAQGLTLLEHHLA